MSNDERDWLAWHQPYDDPSSSLARRLTTVREELRRALDERTGAIHVISMCAGQGRDVLPVVATHPRRQEISALLVELDPRNVEVAIDYASAHGLGHIRILQADAALTDAYASAAPADVVLVCGVFGNITNEDVRRTIAILPSLCAPGATVIWTRGRSNETDRDIAEDVRGWFASAGFTEVAFYAPRVIGFRVGVCRLTAAPRPFERSIRMFQFAR